MNCKTQGELPLIEKFVKIVSYCNYRNDMCEICSVPKKCKEKSFAEFTDDELEELYNNLPEEFK